MEKDKRKGDKPIPDDLEQYLNDLQYAALRRIEGFGWQLKWVRRPLFQDPVIVIMDSDGEKMGVLEEDGEINLEPGIEFRK